MAVGETLLKITDYPFSYSIVVISFAWLGISVQDTKLVSELGVAGSLGTFLAISDPLGRFFKFQLKVIFKKRKQENKDKDHNKRMEYRVRAVETSSIGIEVDKAVGLFYFAFVLSLFAIALLLSNTFVESIQPKDKDGNPIMNLDHIKFGGAISSLVIMIILLVVAWHNWKNVIKHIETVGTYEYAISSEDATRETKESMRNAVDQNDWPTAEEWAAKLEHEIEIRKGQKEEIASLAQNVYEPLYQEQLQIENTFKSVNITLNPSSFSLTEWTKIRSGKYYFMMDDPVLKEEIESFYKLIEDYNLHLTYSFKKSDDIIKNTSSSFYGTQVTQLLYQIRGKEGGVTAPTLAPLLLTGHHPLKIFPPHSSTPINIEISTQQGQPIRKASPSDFSDFDRLWGEMLDKANLDEDISKMRNLFEQIRIKNQDLKIKLQQKIKQQWER